MLKITNGIQTHKNANIICVVVFSTAMKLAMEMVAATVILTIPGDLITTVASSTAKPTKIAMAQKMSMGNATVCKDMNGILCKVVQIIIVLELNTVTGWRWKWGLPMQ